MLKDEHHHHSKGSDANIEDDLQHVLIYACELGIERYREFRAAKPNWKPRSYSQEEAGRHGGYGGTKMCVGCRECLSADESVQIKPQPMVDLSKGAGRVDTSHTKPIQQTRVPVAEIAASCQAMQSFCVSKAPQHHAHIGGAVEVMAASKPPLLLPAGREAGMAVSPERSTRLKTVEVYTDLGQPKKAAELVVAPVALSEQATSSEDMSDDTANTPQRETARISEHAAGISRRESSAAAMASSNYTNDNLARTEDRIDRSLFDYIVTSRKIPYGHSYSNLDPTMRRKLQDHFKVTCPPCPHCNTSTFVKFRYFNNSGKSSLLQPRYTCRNPETCMAMQEKSGKACSRDFTLPRPREGETPKPLSRVADHQQMNGGQGRPTGQSQILPCVGNKRPVQESGSPTDADERCAKLPNTTLSLQTLNRLPLPVVDSASPQIAEPSKSRSVHFAKPTEDSISSSSARTASKDEQGAIKVRHRKEATPENGLVVLKQPISVRTVASGNTETGTGERGSKGGKIAEVNICMYIDLSSASS